MSRHRRIYSLTVASALLTLSACGGGGGGNTPSTGANPITPQACSLRDRQEWAIDSLREWYLFPDTLPANIDPANYATVDELIDAMTATARSQNRDRFFTYLTSIQEENAFLSSGESAGFGVRLGFDSAARRVFFMEVFENSPAFTAELARGDELLAVGEVGASLRLVSDIMASEGSRGVSNALGPSTSGTRRVLRVTNAAGTREITLEKRVYSLEPVSPVYGSRILEIEGRRVGYFNLRTFIDSADDQMRSVFNDFRAQGINEFILDFRYNGGGLVRTAELLGDLLGGNRQSGHIFAQLIHRPEKASRDSIKYFDPPSQAVSPLKLAFITTGASASASELVINGFIPYFSADLGLIGANTFGKPVGQVAIDRSACDDRLRVVAFTTKNASNSDAYFDGLAGAVNASCRASDDISKPLGDPNEASIRQALDFLAGRSCEPIVANTSGKFQASAATAAPKTVTAYSTGWLEPVVPDQPHPAQRETPGLH
ncbi:MAG: S41 family peptidase [Steroidobacteraceae bacterium]|jgi:carboxyl-terminal processing protease